MFGIHDKYDVRPDLLLLGAPACVKYNDFISPLLYSGEWPKKD